MIVLDTHAWIWWVTGDLRLSPKAHQELDNRESVVVPAIVLWETAMLAAKGRLSPVPSVREFIEAGLRWEGVTLQPITPAIAARSGQLGVQLHGDPADRLIVATAIELGVPLVTRDERIRAARIVGLRTVW